MKRTYIGSLSEHKGEEVIIKSWVNVRRDQGKLIFFDFRDMTGYVQGVVLPKSPAMESAIELRPEWVVEIKGKVNPRPEKNVQADKQNGDIELEILEVKVLNRAETPPFDIYGDGREINEEIRLKYRYLDMRRPRLQRIFRNRHKIQQEVRNFFTEEGFTEVETPMMTRSTPEGSRDYVVPSRLEQGKFYALPQSPQQYKQLLMAGGMEKYFQFARCFRDEDTRGDRQPEFTQMDIEMSFVEMEDVMALNEAALINVVKTLYPNKKFQELPFPRMTYKEAMEKYGSDKPDIRKDKNDPDLLAFLWVVDFPFFEKDEKSPSGWTFTHNPFSRPKPEHMDMLMKKENVGDILTTQYDITLNGYEIGGGSIRNHEPEALKKVFEVMGYENDRIVNNFGHMLKAFEMGTPPHGGIAWGFDRFLMLLEGEPNIREVIPFAKTGEGKDPMMESPADIREEQLLELGITVKKKK